MKEARVADEELERGVYRGPLHGIPYGLKDLFAVKGYKTTWGSRPYMNQVIDEDSYVYTQLKKAGAVLCAKLSLGALAYDKTVGSAASLAIHGTCSKAQAVHRRAVLHRWVAGLLPFAIGTETLGSIVSPSTRCGATGLRPTFGTVSRSGGMVLCWSLDKAGPISRSAEDDAIIYSFLKGTDGKDYGSVDHAFNFNGARDVKKLRIAYAENYFNRLPKDAMEWSVLETFKSMGVNLQPVTFPDSAAYPFNIVSVVLNAEIGRGF